MLLFIMNRLGVYNVMLYQKLSPETKLWGVPKLKKCPNKRNISFISEMIYKLPKLERGTVINFPNSLLITEKILWLRSARENKKVR